MPKSWATAIKCCILSIHIKFVQFLGDLRLLRITWHPNGMMCDPLNRYACYDGKPSNHRLRSRRISA